MFNQWTISKRTVLSFAIQVMLTVISCVAGVMALNTVIATKDTDIMEASVRRLRVEEMRVQREKRAKAVRSYLITKNDKYLAQIAKHRDALIDDGVKLQNTAVNGQGWGRRTTCVAPSGGANVRARRTNQCRLWDAAGGGAIGRGGIGPSVG